MDELAEIFDISYNVGKNFLNILKIYKAIESFFKIHKITIDLSDYDCVCDDGCEHCKDLLIVKIQ